MAVTLEEERQDLMLRRIENFVRFDPIAVCGCAPHEVICSEVRPRCAANKPRKEGGGAWNRTTDLGIMRPSL